MLRVHGCVQVAGQYTLSWQRSVGASQHTDSKPWVNRVPVSVYDPIFYLYLSLLEVRKQWAVCFPLFIQDGVITCPGNTPVRCHQWRQCLLVSYFFFFKLVQILWFELLRYFAQFVYVVLLSDKIGEWFVFWSILNDCLNVYLKFNFSSALYAKRN